MTNSLSERSLAGKIAVVTGASRGIGRAIAIRFGQLGAYVVLNYNNSEKPAQAALEAVQAAGAAGAQLIKADISNPAEAQRLINEVLAQHQHLDILINNAGVQKAILLHKMTDADWHQVIDTNLSAVFYLCRAALPAMMEARSGHIVNVGSASGYMGHKGAASYVASKHGLIGLTRVLALEAASKGILVNIVAPGITDTDMVAGLSEAAREQLLLAVPLRRMAKAEEVAAMVAFVVTQASYSTGNTFHVSGGIISG